MRPGYEHQPMDRGARGLTAAAGDSRALPGPYNAQDDYPPLIVKDEVDHHALVMLAEDVRADVRVRAPEVVGVAAPWPGFE